MNEYYNNDEEEREEEDYLEDFPPYDVDELTEDDILSDTVIDYLISITSPAQRIKQFEAVKRKAKQFKMLKPFKDLYHIKDNEKGIKNLEERIGEGIQFPEMGGIIYKTNSYFLDEQTGAIFLDSGKLGNFLVCYHPILPFELYTNLEDGTEKVKLAYYRNGKWKYVIVDRSVISTTQKITSLSDLGIKVNSENAKLMIKYLAEIEELNQDKIKTNVSISRLGWFGDILAPYSNKYEFDNEQEIPNLREKFGESGNLEDWIAFFKERRKYNVISRIALAAGVSSILLKKIKQSGFTIHIWGTSEYGKSVACMAAQSIFGNPSQSDKGIGINFNFTSVGLEYRLNLYNNIPLFINEMQHQKDAKDYDKILFLVSEGTGKSRGTKNGGIARENSWNNVVITNGEKNIIKDNSNAGAYNRCIACEVKNLTYENLPEVADFVKDNYGTPIRKILEHLSDYDLNQIFKEKRESVEYQEITSKQKIIEAILLMADKILTDIIFKDEYYLTPVDFEDKTVNKKDVAIEERAYEVIKDWFMSEKRHFLTKEQKDIENSELKVEIYGKEMEDGYVAIIPSVLKKVLDENGYDMNEVLNAWKREYYIRHDKSKNTCSVRFNGDRTRCVVLDMKKNIENEDYDEEQVELPF